MGAETALQNAALQAGQASMAGYGSGGKFMAEANTMLGQYQPQIFQPESQMGNQAQGMAYQQQMGLAQAKMQQQAQLMKTMQQFGSFGLQGGFNGIMGGGPSGTIYNLGSSFSAGSGGSNLGGGLNLNDYRLGAGGTGISNMSGSGYSIYGR